MPNSINKPPNHFIASNDDEARVSRKFSILTPEEEAEARCLSMIAGAQQGSIDHAPARQTLSELPRRQVAQFDKDLKHKVRAILTENAAILDQDNPNTPNSE